MDKVLVIFSREYIVRVRKKSFIVLSILGPIIFAAMISVPVWLASSETGHSIKEILLLDDSKELIDKIENVGQIRFIKSSSLALEEAKSQVPFNNYYGILHISKDLNNCTLYSTSKPSLITEAAIRNVINSKIKEIKIEELGLSKDQVSFLNASPGLTTILLGDEGSEDQVSTEITSLIAYLGAMLIYFFIIFYASQVMRGIAEEKNNRIVEVMILSVKPFQLMIGKVLGIAAVGLTQLLLWVILTIVIITVGISIISPETLEISKLSDAITETSLSSENNAAITFVLNALESINLISILLLFVFYFISGYLLYSALFAAIGSALGQDSDSQQFTLVVTFPLILALMISSAVLNNPNGSLAIWTSILPLTAPVIMLTRLPFGVPLYELLISAVMMVLGFISTIWMAGRIYRVGILAHNSKVGLKTMVKWFFQK